MGEQRGRRACERGRRGEGSGRIPNQSVLAPDWPGSRAAERRGTTRAPCTRTPQRIAHYVVPKETRPNGRREKGASALPALRYCLWAGCRVRHFPSPVLFSSLSSLSLWARVFLALCCPCPSRGRCVFMPRPHRHTRSNSKAHTPSRMRPRASRCGNMAYALFSSTGPAGLSGIVLLCTPARLAHAPFLSAGAVVLLFPFLAIADGPGDGAGVRAGVGVGVVCFSDTAGGPPACFSERFPPVYISLVSGSARRPFWPFWPFCPLPFGRWPLRALRARLYTIALWLR